MSPLDAVDRLRRTLSHTWRFSIVCVVTEPGPHREWIIDRLDGWSRAGATPPLRLVRPPPGEHLWPLIQRVVGDGEGGGAAGLLLTDLEPYVADDHVEPGLAELNLFRNQLRDLVSGPLVLLVSERVAAGLSRALPDLYSWRAAVCVIGAEDVLAWRSRRDGPEVQPPRSPASPDDAVPRPAPRAPWVPSARRTDHVYVVAAEYANEDFHSPRAVMKPLRDSAGDDAPGLVRLMEVACANALRGLPDPECVTQLHALAVQRDLVAAKQLHEFYQLKQRLLLAGRCGIQLQIDSSNAALGRAGVWRALRDASRPSTAIVVAAQSFEQNASPREVQTGWIVGDERRIGFDMVPMGDLAMDAIAHFTSEVSRVRTPLGDPAGAERLLAMWSDVKRGLATEYRPTLRDDGRGSGSDDLDGRFLRGRQIAQRVTGACAVVLTTDARVVEHSLAHAESRPRRVVRIAGVGGGRTWPSIRQRDEPIVFFHALRQAFSELQGSTGRSLDHLRAASFAVLHDAFPSFEFAALAALGLSPVDIEQRALSYWANPYGGLLGMGDALAASGVSQIAMAFHALTRPTRFFQPWSEGGHHPAFHDAPGPVHALTLSIDGPMTDAVATLIESIPAGSTGSAGRESEHRDETPPPWDRHVDLPAHHRLASGQSTSFDEQAFYVSSFGRAYARGLHDEAAREFDGAAVYGVLEARTLVRLDSVSAAMLPLFRSVDDWCTPASALWRGAPVPLDALKATLAGVLTAPWADGDEALRRRVAELLEAAAASAVASLGGAVARPEQEAAALARQLGSELGVPMGYALVGAHGDASAIHQLCVLTGAHPPPRFEVGDLLEIIPGAVPYARRSKRNLPGLIPPWVTRAGEGDDFAWSPGVVQALWRAQGALDGVDSNDALTQVFEAAHLAIRDVLASPKRAPPRAFCALLRELILNPEPDRDALRACVRALGQTRPPPTRGRTSLYCVIGLLDARASDDLDALRRRLDVVNQAIRRAEAWLWGVAVTHARIGDLFAVSAPAPGGAWAQRWFPALSFARSVYQECLERGERVRAVVTVDEGVPVASIDGTDAAPASRMALAVNTLNKRASGHALFPDETQEGVIVALDAATAQGVARELAPATTDDVAPAFDALWALVGGEQLVPVDAKRGDALVRYGTVPGDESMPTVYYQLRTRRRPELTGPVEAPDDLVASARAVLRELYDSERRFHRFASDLGFGDLASRVDLEAPPDEFWSDFIDLAMAGAVPPIQGMTALLRLLQRAREDYPGNRRIALLLQRLGEPRAAGVTAPVPKP